MERSVVTAATGLLVALAASLGGAAGPSAPVAAAAHASRLPLDFVANRGQWERPTRFVARSGALAASFERNAVELTRGGERPASVRLAFDGASSTATLTGEARRPGVYNFLLGSDAARWRSGVPAYGAVRYRTLYRGVDVRFRPGAAGLEYDLLVAPHAGLAPVVVRVASDSRLHVARDGSLVLRTPAGVLRQPTPSAWELLPGGEKRRVDARFRLLGPHRYGFAAPARDQALALVVDPGLDWATFLGGEGDDSIDGLALTSDGTGDIVVTGQTRSPEFPHASGNLAPVGGTPYVARLNSTGTVLKYATFFGGSFNHSVKDIAVDATGQPVVVGDTNSLDFPTTPGALDRTPGDGFHGDYDAYVIKFNASGGGPVFGTYLGGSPSSANLDQAWQVNYGPGGSVIVSGITTSADFPTTVGALDRTLAGRDIFVSRLDPTGSSLTYSTFVGGDSYDEVFAMAVDGQGFVTLTGKTAPSGAVPFPTTPDAFDRTPDTRADAFVARLKLDGAGAADLRYSTFLGGDQYIEAGDGIAVDPADSTLVTVSGFTRSGDFPTTVGALLRTHFAPIDTSMGWVARFRFPAAGAGTLVWSTLYGAPGNQSADDVVVDSTGAAIIAGGAGVSNPPTTDGSYDRVPGSGYGIGLVPAGKADGYVARISADGSRVLYSTLLGGAYGDAALHIGYAGGASVVVAGETASPDFPVTTGALDTLYGGDGKPSGNSAPGTLAADGFVARLTLAAPAAGDTTPPAAPNLLWPAEGSAYTAFVPGIAFDWSDVADPSGIRAYHIQISPNPTFTDDIDAELSGWFEAWLPTSVAVKGFSVSETGTFSWRVQALDGANNLGPWSAVRTITVSLPTPPAAPTLLSPPNGGRFAPGNVTFAWNAAAGAKFYELQVDTTSAFSNAGKIWIRAIAQTQYTVSLTAERTYFWRVLATNDSFTASPWSAAWSLEIKSGSPTAPTPPPPAPAPAPPPATGLVSLKLDADVTFGANPVGGTVTLGSAAPAGGAVVALASNYPSRAAVPPSVTVPAGSTTATFTVTPTHSARFAQVMITAEYGGAAQGAQLNVYADDPITDLDNFTVSTNTVSGGATVQATVSILFTFVAGPDGALVTLGSTNPALASVPPSVTIAPGTSSASFTITTQPVSTATDVTILAAHSLTLRQTIQLLPPGALSALGLNPSTVTGGTSSQGTVTLSGPAPAGGVVVALSSSDTAVATVPASVTVAAGATSATFTVTTKPVSGGGTFSIITATAGGLERTATINVNPGAAADTVSVTRAEYDSAGRTLRVDATSTKATATLQVFVSSTGALIGTLSNKGGGSYSGQFSWPSNPQSITVKSSLGGSATRAVTAK